MKTREIAFTTDPILPLTWKIALPISVGMFFNTLFNVVDTLCAGWLGTVSLAAVALNSPLLFLFFAMGSGIAQATTALLAHAMGNRDRDLARRIFVQAVGLGLLSGWLLSMAGWVCGPALFRLLGAEGEYLQQCLQYANTVSLSGVVLVLPGVLNTPLAAAGFTLFHRNFLVAACLLNLGLNPVLMWGIGSMPGMGVGGIALATVVVHLGGILYLGGRVRKVSGFSQIRWIEFMPDWKLLGRIFRHSVPAVCSMFLIPVGMWIVTWFVGHFGADAVAAAGIASRIEQVFLMPMIGLGAGLISIVGQNHGASLPGRVREAWWTNILMGVGLSLCGGVMLGLLRKEAMALFTSDPRIVEYGSGYLAVAATTLAAYSILFGTFFAMQGLQRPFYGVVMGLIRQVMTPTVVLYLLIYPLSLGLESIWWGIAGVSWGAALFALAWGHRHIGSSSLQPRSQHKP